MPYEGTLGEIMMVAFNFPPKNWAFCNGQILSIAQNQALFSLLGTMYGGNGVQTFGLPDLRGRTPIHFGGGFQQGQNGGEENHTLTPSELPLHIHPVNASTNAADDANPGGNLLAVPAGYTFGSAYAVPTQLSAMAPGAVDSKGGSESHANMQPYLVLRFCICLAGIFPDN